MVTGDHSSAPYFEVHPGNGPYLLLVHGLLSSRAQWMLNIEALAKVTRPVIVELLGHGRSPAPESPAAYRPAGYVEAFENIRKRLGISAWLLCGQSLGAGLTLRYALNHPERIIAHVITNSTSSFREVNYMEEVKNSTADYAEKLLEQGLEGIKKIPVHPANARKLRADVKAALLKDCADLSVLGVANAIRYTRPEISVRREVYKNIVPTLLVCGKREKRFQPFRDFAQTQMPLLDIVDLEAGHAVNIDAAEEFNDKVTAFFIKQTAGRM
jgi:2-succinyl-6-hydroxy-2,4-cyclohexadiene-1-carboxylate synthase